MTMLGTFMEPRLVTDEDIAFWYSRGDQAQKVEMRGDHIGARNIDVVHTVTPGEGQFARCWRVPYVVPDGDGTTFWFSMFCEGFPPVSALTQPPADG